MSAPETATKVFSSDPAELKALMDKVHEDKVAQTFHTTWAKMLAGKELQGTGVIMNFRLALYDWRNKNQYPDVIGNSLDAAIEDYMQAVIVDAPEVLSEALAFNGRVMGQVAEDRRKREEAEENRLGGMLSLLQGMLKD